MNLFKYHGAGNDFIIVDALKKTTLPDSTQIAALCNRHTGIGGDGLIIIEPSLQAEFKMRYFNSDGLEAEMCGNGARCAVAFCFTSGYCKKSVLFEASDGLHHGSVLKESGANEWLVRVTLNIAEMPRPLPDGSFFVNTGVPHNVRIADDLMIMDVVTTGRQFRNNKSLFPEGANINFITLAPDSVHIRTYERGVEDETLACGTGITASALVAHTFLNQPFPIRFHALGGMLTVDRQEEVYWLEGPAKHVFTVTLPQ